MDAFPFWYKWLLVMTVIIMAFGFGMAFFNQTALFDSVFNVLVDSSFWGTESPPNGIFQFQSWIYGVLGATMGGWGIVLIYITKNAFFKREKWAWKAVAIALITWYLVDSAISLYFGVIFNAIFNSIIFILVLLPLVMTRKHFMEA